MICDPVEFIEKLWDADTEFEYLYSGREDLPENFNRGPYTFDSHLISVLSKGALTYTINGKEVFANAGSALWLNAFSQCRIHCLPDYSPATQLWYRFRVKYKGEIMLLDSDYALTQACLSAQQLSNELLPNRSLASRFWENQRHKSVLSSMISRICENVDKGEDSNDRGLYPSQKRMILEFIHDRLEERFYLEDMAKHVQLHKTYLSTQFKKSFGMSLQAYVKKCRIEKAAKLMLKHKYRVNQISKIMGYDNDFFFSRQFKEVMGMSPSYWLSNQLEDQQKKAQ